MTNREWDVCVSPDAKLIWSPNYLDGNKPSTIKVREITESSKDQLEMARKFISSWAWIGDNGSPYTEQQAKTLQYQIQNDAWDTYIKIFGEKP